MNVSQIYSFANMKTVFLDAATIGEDISLDPISSLGELTCWPNSTPQQARERVKEAEILIINKIKVDSGLLDAAPHLKLICEAATGVNNIDLASAAERNIPVRNVAGYSTESVVQLTFTHILSLLCRAPYYDSRVKSGEYSRSGLFTDVTAPFPELSGKRMGIVGMGNIGTRVAQVASAFGMRVSYFSTSGTSHCTEYPSVDIDTLLRESDVVSIHAPLNSTTRGLIDADRLNLMKRSAILVNMGRGGIVDEAALAGAIDEGTIAGAGLDVFAVEPLPQDSPLLHVAHPERLSLAPHIGWASVEARRRLVDGIAENIRSYLESL